MENIAYLQAAIALDSRSPHFPSPAVKFSNLFRGLKMSGVACTRWIAIAASLSILAITSEAIALGIGDSGEAVRCLQQTLAKTGYFHGPITGYYGSMTKNAVLHWEKDSAGIGDGAVQPTTVAQLQCYTPQPDRSDRPSETYLSRGDRSSAVTQLQQQLTTAGYYQGPITGYYGSLTQAAVMRVQRDFGLPVDGVAGANTLFALAEIPEPASFPTYNTILRRGSSGAEVVYLQEDLRNLGYYSGPVTGYYGQLTQEAVMKLQRDRGLRADGVAGPQTQRMLIALY